MKDAMSKLLATVCVCVCVRGGCSNGIRGTECSAVPKMLLLLVTIISNCFA